MIKEVNINMGPILSGSEFMGVFNCRQGPPVNHALQFTLRDLEPAGTGTVNRSCNSQLALFTTERQCAWRPEVAFSKTC